VDSLQSVYTVRTPISKTKLPKFGQNAHLQVNFSYPPYSFSYFVNSLKMVSGQCCGSGMFYPGSRIPDPTSFLQILFTYPGSRIPDPDPTIAPSRIPDPGGKKSTGSRIPDPGSGSGSATLVSALQERILNEKKCTVGNI
jgi:hypothetical protein